MVEPSLRTVIRSATYETSFNLCVMIIEVSPSSLNPRSISSSIFESSSFSDEVGSSRIRSLTFFESAFAISTSCCLPVPISLIKTDGLSLRPTLLICSPALTKVSPQLIFPILLALSFPRNIFSAIVSSGIKASS